MVSDHEIFAFIFDSGRLEGLCYGDVVFESMLKGKELTKNASKIVVSAGDIFTGRRDIDIEPYVIKDEYCTLDFDALAGRKSFKDYPFCWIVEDLSAGIAREVDQRLKKTLNGYAGMARIDRMNTSKRKQFWKYMVRVFAICGETITCFQDPQLEGEFVYSEAALELGYKIEYSKEAEYADIEDCEMLQSGQVKSEEDLKALPQAGKDVDRDLLILNFSIREEIQISGTLIWRAVNAVDRIFFHEENISFGRLVEYPFLALYFATQGVERIQKAIIELACKKNHIQEKEKAQVYDLLVSHAHDKLNDWIEDKQGIKFNTNCRKLISILTRFYKTVRYARYSDENYMKTAAPEYSLLLELKSQNCQNPDRNIKQNFGKYLGQLTHTYFKVFCELCHALNIYAYELEYDSAATIVYNYQDSPRNLYEELLRRQQGKREVLYWLMKKARDYPKSSWAEEDALDLDAGMMEHYLCELLFNPEDGQEYYNEVDSLYDELCAQDKTTWKNRVELIDYMMSKKPG